MQWRQSQHHLHTKARVHNEHKSIEKYAQQYDVDPQQLKMGIDDEKEHDDGSDLDVVNSFEDLVKIAVAHLKEDPQYYTKLKKAIEH